jgi:hypothetical protein
LATPALQIVTKKPTEPTSFPFPLTLPHLAAHIAPGQITAGDAALADGAPSIQ